MKACFDVHYKEDMACAAAVIFNDWSDTKPFNQYSVTVTGYNEYEPGQFYRRELDPLLSVIELIEEPLELLIIDAYCYLSTNKTPGLGAYLYQAISGRTAIVGVAKNRFRDSNHAAEVRRGGSNRPLFVTSIGLPQSDAAEKIASMAGDFRIPTLLKLADQIARKESCACPTAVLPPGKHTSDPLPT